MKEIEIKILDIDQDQTENKLREIGADKTAESKVEADFYDFADRSLKASGKKFRLRTVGNKGFLTFKSNLKSVQAKVREEFETEVSDLEALKMVAQELGLQSYKHTSKTRISYKLGNAFIELDKYHNDLEFIPMFLEIEAPDIKTIHQVAERLGFKKEDCTAYTISDLINYYKKL